MCIPFILNLPLLFFPFYLCFEFLSAKSDLIRARHLIFFMYYVLKTAKHEFVYMLCVSATGYET